MLSGIQLLGVIFVLFVLAKLSLKFKQRQLSFGEYLLWVLIWGVLLFILVFPNITFIPARWLGVYRGVDLIVYLSIALLYLLVYNLYVKVESVEREITTLVRTLALKKLDKRKK